MEGTIPEKKLKSESIKRILHDQTTGQLHKYSEKVELSHELLIP